MCVNHPGLRPPLEEGMWCVKKGIIGLTPGPSPKERGAMYVKKGLGYCFIPVGILNNMG